MVRSSLSHDDRELIRSGPRWVMIAQQAIDQGDSRVEMGREEEALKEFLESYESDNTLVKLATAVGANEKYGDKDANAAQALAQLRRIEDVLDKVDNDEGDEYRDFLMEVGTKIVQATGRGVLGVGRKTSGGERRALEQIEAALKARESDKRARAAAERAESRRDTERDAKEAAAARRARRADAAETRESAEEAREKLAAQRAEANERRRREAVMRKAEAAQEKAELEAQRRMRAERIEKAQKERARRASAPQERTYTVQKGDSLWKIAADQLGDGNRWKEIHEANKEQIKDPNLIRPGQELVIPEK